MNLAPHTKANREFFEPGCAPTARQWADWVERGVVRGKIIDGKPYIDLNWSAANDCMRETKRLTGLSLLAG